MKKRNSFKIYNASAGSGKTFTLVKDYLVLLLASNRADAYRNILAITFTNKAVAEMKGRIVSGLRELGREEEAHNPSNLFTLLVKETHLSPETIRMKSRRILKSIVNNYSAFEVSTIDGFTHRVLRTFARDLDLPLNFEVALNIEDVLSEAVDRVISKAGNDKALTKVLVHFVLGKTDEDKSWDIERDLLDIAKLLTQETSRPYLDRMKNHTLEDFNDLSATLKNTITKKEEAAIRTAEEFFELIESAGIEEGDFKGKYCPDFFSKIRKKNFKVNFNTKWQENIASQDLYKAGLVEEKKRVLDALQPEVAACFHRTRKEILEIEFLKAVQKKLVPLSLLSSIQNEIEEIKKENAILLISEFNAAIGEAIKDQPAPFVYERLGELYRHYFIDEFQDTSALQWENLIPLVDQALSVEHHPGEHGSLTLVGDAKQSIYRWRGGKAEQFMELCNDRNPFSLEEKDIIILPKNYRSARTIVNFNNDFFRFSAACFENNGHKELFETSAQDPTSEIEGSVNLSFIEAANVEEEMDEYPKRILQILEELEENDTPRGDICILTRKKKEGIAIANFLSEKGISVISAESLLLVRSPEVVFVTNLLRFSIDTSNKQLKFELLSYLLEEKGVGENEFLFLNSRLTREGQEFFDSLEPFGIRFSLNELNSLSVYEAVEYVIRSFDLVHSSNAYLQFYLDFVHESTHSSGTGISDFLELWDQKKKDLSIVVPKGENAVQIMTIHRAKGLEFPVVIYPFANSAIQDIKRQSFWIHLPANLQSKIDVAYLDATDKMRNWEGGVSQLYEELCFNSRLDALNVLYVALTRPVQKLYVISKLELDKKGNENRNKISGLLISYLKSLGRWTGALEYSFGNPTEVPQRTIEEGASVEQEAFYSSPTQANGITIVTRAGLLWDSSQQAAIEKGSLVHELFARVDSAEDLDPVLRKAGEEGMIKEQDMGEIRKIMDEVVYHPALNHFFEQGVQNYNERTVVSGTGEILRPDRLNFEGKKVSIIDYKTGVAASNHHTQVEGYASVLQGMGYQIDKKVLVYLNNGVSVQFV